MFTRDNAAWLLLFIIGVLGFLIGHFDALQSAFPSIGPIWNQRLEFFFAFLGFVAGYLRLSPLPLDPSSSLAKADADPTRTLNPFSTTPSDLAHGE